jgi:hypothetical protein
MKVFMRFFLAITAFGLVTAMAKPVKPAAPSIRDLVDQFYAQKESAASVQLFSFHPPRREQCEEPMPTGPSCRDVACDKLGHFGCDDMSEVSTVNRACRGNYDGQCLEVVCNKLGHFGCDDMSEVQTVARACVGNYGTECFEDTCTRLGHFGCDDVSEVQEVLRECAGN